MSNHAVVYSIRDFNFCYPGCNNKIAFKGSLCINKGDCILLQGNSGSGKSTLLQALKGVIPHVVNGIYSGEILFHGFDVSDLHEMELTQIGYLQQNPDSQLVCHDVFSELAFGLENQQVESNVIRHKINEYASRFAITHLLTRQTNTLSGGEKQKVNLIAILLMEPEVLLLDEPTAFLDPESAHEVMHIVRQLSHQKTVILIEHNLHYLQGLINRSIVIDNQGNMTEQTCTQINWQPVHADLPCKYHITQKTIEMPKNDLDLEASHIAINALLVVSRLNLVCGNFDVSSSSHVIASVAKQSMFTVAPGNVIGIIGRNGSGKSTLLKLIAKLIPSTNSIYWQGQDIAQLKKSNYWQQVALLWQNPENHFLHHTVMDELEHNHELLERIGLINHATQNPFGLSEGQKRRLSMAITLLKTITQLYLLDEPTFGQDMQNKLILAQLISDLAIQGKSFIIVSHDMAFLESLTDQIYRLEHA